MAAPAGHVAGSSPDRSVTGNSEETWQARSSGFILVFGIFFVATQSVSLSRLIRVDRVAGKREGDSADL